MMIGHKKQWDLLVGSLKLGKLPHALIFSGEEKLGKRTLAVELAKLINCENSEKGLPCQQCRNCKDIEKNQHPDVAFVSPQGKEIQIAQIRELGWRLSLKPRNSRVKMVIIDSCHAMNQQAQNCFLKILEEPKGETLFILLTEHPQTLLPTIVSRAQKIKFFPVAKRELTDYLSANKISKDVLQKIMSVSMGRPGATIDFLQNPAKLKEQEKIILDLARLVKLPLAKKFEYAKETASDSSGETAEEDLPAGESQKSGVRQVLDVWLGYARESLTKQAEIFKSSEAEWKKIAKTKKIIQLIQKLDYLLSTTNINPKLALEILMLEI